MTTSKPVILAIVTFAITAAALLISLAGVSAQTATAPFYAGKQIKLITHVGPASGYSVWARLVGSHLGRHIPGAPSIAVVNMPGAGGLKAANYLFGIAAKDGSELGAVNRLVPTLSIM